MRSSLKRRVPVDEAAVAPPAPPEATVHRFPLSWFLARPGSRWWVVGTVCLGAFMGQLDASIATLVIPTLRTVFHSRLAYVEWVAISYLLTLVALVVMFGRLADMFGRKELYTLGFVVFTAGSVACGAAPTLEVLILARIAQAVGAAMLQANSVAIITAAVDRNELGRAIGIQGAAQAVGLSVGPALGGFLISQLGWRWVFYINLPVGIVGTALGWLVLSSSAQRRRPEPFDWAGLGLFGTGVTLLMYATTQGGLQGWSSPNILAMFGISSILLALFLLCEVRTSSPMVDLTLFQNRLFSAGIVAGLLSYAVLFGALFLMPVFMEVALHRSAENTGLTLAAVPIALALAAPLAGALSDRFGSRGLTVGGMLLASVALLGLDKVSPNVEWLLLGVLALFGLGLGAFTPPNNASIMGAAPRHRLGIASGILNMTRGMGTSVGVVATGAVLSWRRLSYADQLRPRGVGLRAFETAGAFHDTVLFLMFLALLAGVISLVRGRSSPLESFPESQPELL
jgi:EmrB/QacA subfamily drug resistance transporter